MQGCFAREGWKIGDFLQAELADKESLALPIYAELNEEQKTTVVEAIAEILPSREAGLG